MPLPPKSDPAAAQDDNDASEDGDLSDMLSEQRILLPGAQMLTAFLVLLPFNGTFAEIIRTEKFVFLATFFFSLSSLILLSAPAVQHRLMRPLNDRVRFKRFASTQIVIGSCTLACAFILASDLVISQVFGATAGIAAGA